MTIKVGKNEAGQRLDLYVLSKLPKIVSRSFLQKLIKEGQIKVNNRVEKASYRVKPNDEISLPDRPTPQQVEIVAEPIELQILYEDPDLIVVNKPAGMIVHPIPSHTSGTLVNALLYHCKDLQGIGGELRPGIVHRLDKETSGVIVVAKNDFSHRSLSAQFKNREVFKMYFAVIHGCPDELEGEIQINLARHPTVRVKMTVAREGRSAVTLYKILKRFGNLASLAAVYPKTGRTHQIRVHMKYIGHPILGDRLYGKADPVHVERQLLHAAVLEFKHPRSNEKMRFVAPLPEDFKSIIRRLHEESTK
ncbi:RluA family pseudouridine synthase [Pseudothermotoga sp.]|nr:RluA family pseudouridine synthase [Pseudothermotoga sp.]MCX7812963.1 RluA family pseudouridine synthase [Pseudothermotoga sp.]MDW8139798.1 RluA family pseudouridine synthase [Pseudothermotoga sp.]